MEVTPGNRFMTTKLMFGVKTQIWLFSTLRNVEDSNSRVKKNYNTNPSYLLLFLRLD